MVGALKFNFDLVKWELIVAAILLIITVLIARGKNVKRAIAFLAVSLILLTVAFFDKCLVLLALDNPTRAVRIAVAWGPTIEFVLILVGSTLLGVWRGFRKSALFMLHAVCAAAVCLGLFFFLTRSKAVDRGVLKLCNLFVDIRAKLGVSAECSTMREVLAEWIPSRLNYGAELNIVLKDNGAYLMTVVDMAYRIAFAVLLYFVYLFLLFILYLIYHAAYSERKYKRRKEKLLQDNRTDRKYCKHPVYGGVVGFVRGLTAGLLSLAFMGTLLFMVADIGKTKSQNLDFSNKKIDRAYEIFQAVEGYGSHGIFRFLNTLRDGDDQPYYLFAADLIFSGELDDKDNGIHVNVKFRKEMGAYSKFARQTLDLMLRHGGDEIRNALNGTGDADAKTAVLNVFKNEQFQAEFEVLIDEFDTQTYFINFALSAATSLLDRIEETRFADKLSENNRELMKILFRAGYLSEKIPDELALIESGVTEGEQPYIGIPQLYAKSDAKIYYKLVTSFLLDKPDGKDDTLALVRTLLPQLQQLSFLSSDRAQTVDPVLGRVYCFLANTYLKGENDTSAGVRYGDIAKAKVDWTRELYDLISVAEDGYTLYDAYKANEGTKMDKVLSLFDTESADYGKNMEAYDRIAQTTESSKLLGQVLSTGKLHEKLCDVFASVSENIYIPRYITYENTQSGNGELHWLLYGLKQLGNKENRALLNKLTAEDAEVKTEDVFELIANATGNRDEYGGTLATYMTESVFLRSLISSVMLDNEEMLYIPSATLERDGADRTVRLIRKDVLGQLFDSLSQEDIRKPILDFVKDEEGEQSSITALLQNDAVAEILCNGNGIIEGTVAKQLEQTLKEYDKIKVPQSLRIGEDGVLPDGWLTTTVTLYGKPHLVEGELCRLVRALRLKGIDIDDLLDKGQIDNTLLKTVMDADPTAHVTITQSDILHYTLSRSILEGELTFGQNKRTIIVPVNVVIDSPSDGKIIEKSEMQAFLLQIAEVTVSNGSTPRELITQLIDLKDHIGDSAILCATMAEYLVEEYERGNEGAFGSSGIVIPDKYLQASDTDNDHSVSAADARLWQEELHNFAAAAEVLFGTDGDIKVDGALIGKLSKSDDDFRTVYASNIVGATFTDTIKKLTDTPIVDHQNAYKQDFHLSIYRTEEVQVLLDLLEKNGEQDLQDFKLIKASELRAYIYDESNPANPTRSWLLAATLSSHLLKNGSLYIPTDVLDSTGNSVLPAELAHLIDAYIAYNGDGSLHEWKAENWRVPTMDEAHVMLKSTVIRATLTREIRMQYHNEYESRPGSDKGLYFRESEVVMAERAGEHADEGIKTPAAYLSEEQLRSMFAILNSLSSSASADNPFVLPQIDSIGAITSLTPEQVELYVQCDELRYQISNVLLKSLTSERPEEQPWYNLTYGNEIEIAKENVSCYTREQIFAVLSSIPLT